MKKKICCLVLTSTLAASMLLSGCGSKETAETVTSTVESAVADVSSPADVEKKVENAVAAAPEAIKELETVIYADAEEAACSDELFTALQASYAKLTEAYDKVSALYSDSSVNPDALSSELLTDCADIIESISELKQEDLTDEVAATLTERVDTLTDSLNLITENFSAVTSLVSDLAFDSLSDEYDSLKEMYELAVAHYESTGTEPSAEAIELLEDCSNLSSDLEGITESDIPAEDAKVIGEKLATVFEGMTELTKDFK